MVSGLSLLFVLHSVIVYVIEGRFYSADFGVGYVSSLRFVLYVSWSAGKSFYFRTLIR